jgi:hypothetical protein
LAAHATQLDTDPIWLIRLLWDLPLLHLDISDYQQIAEKKKKKKKKTTTTTTKQKKKDKRASQK